MCLDLHIRQKEPFDIPYFTASITLIVNPEDKGYSLSRELLYAGITNLELRLKGTFLAGDGFSEFWEKQKDYRMELRARYCF